MVFVRVLIVLLSFLPSVNQFFTQFIGNYYIGLVLRVATHVLVPLFGVMYILKKGWLDSFLMPLRFKGFDKRFWKITLVGSFGAMFLIIGVFYAIRPFMDISLIVDGVSELYDLTICNYLLICFLITFVNSFIEEYFWRGFVFRAYHKRENGYWTGILFAVHHVVMLFAWFNSWWQLLLISIGLAVVGVYFNWMYEKTDSMYASWITHIFADLTIVTIGFVLFFG